MATSLHEMGVVTTIDRAALAAYCQAYGRWVEAEERMRESQLLYKTPSGHVQQSPLLGIINKQLELMGRYLIELGMTPASRSRVAADLAPADAPPGSGAKELLMKKLETIAQRLSADGMERLPVDETIRLTTSGLAS